MNIISNTCVGSYIMRDCLHQQYVNPFCWNIIDPVSMYNLIKNFNSINFGKWRLQKDDKWIFSIVIDNLVKVKYVHYHFSPNDLTIRSDGVDVFYHKIWEYVVAKYVSRINRMKETPTFVIATSYPNDYFTKPDIERICSIRTNYKIVINNNNINLDRHYDNIIFDTARYHMDNLALAKHLTPLLGDYR